jgi:class 3 adenylate cyclase
MVKLMGDGALVEFASAVDAVECGVAVQRGVTEREAAVPENRRIAFRIGVNISDIIVEDSDILGDGVNIAALVAAGGAELWLLVDECGPPRSLQQADHSHSQTSKADPCAADP